MVTLAGAPRAYGAAAPCCGQPARRSHHLPALPAWGRGDPAVAAGAMQEQRALATALHEAQAALRAGAPPPHRGGSCLAIAAGGQRPRVAVRGLAVGAQRADQRCRRCRRPPTLTWSLCTSATAAPARHTMPHADGEAEGAAGSTRAHLGPPAAMGPRPARVAVGGGAATAPTATGRMAMRALTWCWPTCRPLVTNPRMPHAGAA
jgi:hypothetical protein